MRPLLLLFSLLLFSPLAEAQRLSKPERNFESFWKGFQYNYAHFDVRRVDWSKQYQKYRPLVSSRTTDEELFSILLEMVEPLKDGHVSLSKVDSLPASAKYSTFHQEFPTKDLVAQLRDVTFKNLQEQGFGPFTRFNSASHQIGGFCHSLEYGYLQLAGFGGLPLDEFNAQLETMAEQFKDKKAIIIDIRVNGGGIPDFVSAVAGRFFDKKRLVGYGQRKKGPGKDDFTALMPSYLSPQGKTRLIKPIILLTSGAAISAADHFAMWMKELPYVKVVGENTNGLFSSMLAKRLPNGWEYSLSNERNSSAKKVCYEAIGVPVDVRIANKRDDIARAKDPVLMKALEVLNRDMDALASKTINYEQKALDFFVDSLLLQGGKYGGMKPYFNGMVEEDATLLSPFERAQCSFFAKNRRDAALEERLTDESRGESSFFQANVQSRFYLDVRDPVQQKRRGFFTKRNAKRIQLSHHIAVGDKRYIRIDLPGGRFNGDAILVVTDSKGEVINYCTVTYNFVDYVLN